MFHSNGILKPSNNYFRWRRSKNEDPIEVDRARHGSGVVVVGMAFESHPIVSSDDGDRNMNWPSTSIERDVDRVTIGDAILGVHTLPETQVDNGRSCLITGDEILELAHDRRSQIDNRTPHGATISVPSVVPTPHSVPFAAIVPRTRRAPSRTRTPPSSLSCQGSSRTPVARCP